MQRGKGPNILWIMTDQQRLDAMGCTGGQVFTPNMDRLAAEGVLFTQMFAQSPVCVPSRVNFITGRYPHSHQVRQNHTMVGQDEPHMFRVLRQAGYYLGIVGKNHMFDQDDLQKLDFERCSSNEIEPDSDYTRKYNRHLGEIKERMREVGSWAGACWHDFPDELTRTGRTSKAAVDFLDNYEDDRPFMLWVSFEDPHAPHTAPERFRSLYPEESMSLPDDAVCDTDHPELNNKPNRQQIKRHAQGMTRATAADLRRYTAVYRAMISFVDEQVGKLIDSLESRGILDDTIIIFTSDHGDFLCDHGMVKKDLLMYDCQLNIPFIIRWPGLDDGKRIDAMCEQIDIYPTLLDCLDLEIPPSVQGQSFKRLLNEESKSFRTEIHAEICPPDYRNSYKNYDNFIADWRRVNQEGLVNHPLHKTAPFNIPGDFIKCLRTATHKYVWYACGEEELYDLEDDSGEKVNLAGKPEYTIVKADLKLRLLEWNALSEDPLDAILSREIADNYPW
jgi:arylsulfatase